MIDPWALCLLLYTLGFFQNMGWSSEGAWGQGQSANLKFWFSFLWPLLMLGTVIVALAIMIKRAWE